MTRMKFAWVIFLSLTAQALPGQPPAPALEKAQRGLVKVQTDIPFMGPLRGNYHWTGTRLAGCDFCVDATPTLWAVDRQGSRQAVALDIPNAGSIVVRDVASGPDGSLTAIGFAMDDSRSGTFLVWISPDSTRQVLTRLWPYSANALTVAPDGTVWTVGSVGNDAHVRIAFNVLRHYTPSGQLLTSTVVSGLRKRWDGEVDVTSNTRLMASNDRIGWLTDACQYVEFSFESVQLGSYTCPNGYDRQHMVDGGVALSSANDLLILPTGGRPLGPLAPLELDRAANTWKTVPVTLDSAEPQLILGFDGLNLVTSGYSKSANSLSMRRYAWSERVPASQ